MARALVAVALVALWACVVVADVTILANGDKQLNNVISKALAVLNSRRRFDAIDVYFDPGSPYSSLTITDVSQCLREIPAYPVGALLNVMQTGSLRFCLPALEVGSVPDGADYGYATQVFPVLGVGAGDLYGPEISIDTAIANEVGLLLETPINAAFVLCTSTSSGVFYDTINYLNKRLCDVSTLDFYQLPSRDLVGDFSCPVWSPDLYAAFQVDAVPSIPSPGSNETTGSICSSPGSTQYLLAQTYFPYSPIVNYTTTVDMWQGFCFGQCQYVIDALEQGNLEYSYFCPHLIVRSSLLPPTTPEGFVGVFTLKSSDVTSVTFSEPS